MKKILLVSVLAFGLAACGDATADVEAEEAPAEEVAAVEPAGTAIDGGSSVGTYRITDEDGSVSTYDARADGTVVSTNADGTEETGTWRQESPEMWCDTLDGQETCYDEAVDENGVWTSTNRSDQTLSTLERIES